MRRSGFRIRFFLILLMLGSVAGFAADAPKDAQWINQVFQKGKAYYEAGKFDAAAREWKQLDPYLDQYPSLKKVITYLENKATPGAKAQPDTEQVSIRAA